MRSSRCLARWMLTAIGSSFLLASTVHAQEVHAIENTRIWVGDGQVVEGVHLLLRDGLIEAIGADITIPPDAVKTDGAGLTVYPGWMDAYSNLGVVIPDAPEDPPAGNAGAEPNFTQESQPRTREANRRGIHSERRARDFLKLPEADAGKLREAGFTHMVSASADGFLRGMSCITDLSGTPPRRSVIGDSGWTHAHLRHRHRGGYPGTLMANLAHVRQTLHDARRLRAWQELERRKPQGTPRSPDDSSLEALFACFDGETPVAFEADSENDILRALNMAQEFHLRPIIVGGRNAWKVADRLAAEKVPVIAALDFPDEPEREGAKKKKADKKKDDAEATEADPEASGEPNGGNGHDHDGHHHDHTDDSEHTTNGHGEEHATNGNGNGNGDEHADDADSDTVEWEVKDPINAEPLKLYQERLDRWHETVQNVATLVDAGVVVALTSHGTSPDGFVEDLAVACEHGLTEEAALAALTSVPAQLTGVDANLGMVAVGRTANLTLIGGSPVGDDRNVRYTFVAGHRFEFNEKKDKKSKGESDGEGGERFTALGGTWKVTASDDAPDFTLVIEPDDEEVTGQLKSEMGEWDVSRCELDGNEFHIVVNVEFNTQSFEFVLKGTVDGDTIRGTLETPFGDPTAFEGERTAKPGEEEEYSCCH